MTSQFASFLLEAANDAAKIKKGIDYIMRFRNQIPEQFRPQVDPGIKSGRNKVSKAKGTEIEEYIRSVFK